MARTKKPPKPKRPKKPPKPKAPPKWHEQPGAGSAGKSGERAQPAQPRGMSVGAGAVSAVMELVASADRAAGLATVVLELAGEGKVSLGAALSAWQHEQERVSNRTWRRPGGLARMGGL